MNEAFVYRSIGVLALLATTQMTPALSVAEQRGIRVDPGLGVVTALEGEAVVEYMAHNAEPLHFQDRVKQHGQIRTSREGHVEVLWDNRFLMTIPHDSAVVVRASDSAELIRGGMDIALPIGSLGEGKTFRLITPHARLDLEAGSVSIHTNMDPIVARGPASKKANQMPISPGDVIYVHEGSVQLTNTLSNVRSTVAAGEAATISGLATTHSGNVPLHTHPVLAQPSDREPSVSTQKQIMDLHRHHVVAFSEVLLRNRNNEQADASTTVASTTNAPTTTTAGYVATSNALTSGAGANGILTAAVLPSASASFGPPPSGGSAGMLPSAAGALALPSQGLTTPLAGNGPPSSIQGNVPSIPGAPSMPITPAIPSAPALPPPTAGTGVVVAPIIVSPVGGTGPGGPSFATIGSGTAGPILTPSTGPSTGTVIPTTGLGGNTQNITGVGGPLQPKPGPLRRNENDAARALSTIRK
jgi:hypothetical protein